MIAFSIAEAPGRPADVPLSLAMSSMFQWAFGLMWLILSAGCWLGWQLLRQNGRMLLRLEQLEKRVDELEFGEPDKQPRSRDSEPVNQNHATSAATNGETDRAHRFSNRSLARSRIKRDGLSAGTPAPRFQLPRLDGRGDLSLEELCGRRVLLVFSDPHCGPCNHLAPQLEQFYRHNRASERGTSFGAPPDLELVMITRGDPGENRTKAKEYGLTFPIVVQRQWEISRLYAMLATPTAYFLDEQGVIANNVAVGVDAILALLNNTANHMKAMELNHS